MNCEGAVYFWTVNLNYTCVCVRVCVCASAILKYSWLGVKYQVATTTEHPPPHTHTPPQTTSWTVIHISAFPLKASLLSLVSLLMKRLPKTFFFFSSLGFCISLSLSLVADEELCLTHSSSPALVVLHLASLLVNSSTQHILLDLFSRILLSFPF